MANLLLGGVMQGLVGASGAMKSADTAYYVYVQKKAQGDEEGMRRAMGYATDHMSDANTYTEESKTALTDNIQAAREQEKAEQAESVEKARQESAEEKIEMQGDADDPNQKIMNPVDTIEISPEAIEAFENDMSDAAAQIDNTLDASVKQPVQYTGNPIAIKHAMPHARTSHVKVSSGENAKLNPNKININL